MDTAQGHIGHEQRAAARQACIAELPVHRAPFVRRQHKLPHDFATGNLHHHCLGRLAVLHEHHVLASDGLHGVNLRTLRCRILPDGLSVGIHLGHPILMGHQYVSVRHQYGVANLAALQLVLITPADLSVPDDEHAALLALPGIKEIVSRKILVYHVLCHATLHRHCENC